MGQRLEVVYIGLNCILFYPDQWSSNKQNRIEKMVILDSKNKSPMDEVDELEWDHDIDVYLIVLGTLSYCLLY